MSSSSTYYEPTICDANVKQHSGRIQAGSKNGRDNYYFYWLFESRKDPQKDPLLMWLNGGPGCSSMFGLFLENGPCQLTNNGTSINDTIYNPYSWNSNANLIFVDQPPNVGFSTGPIVSTLDEISQDMYAFLQHFMQTFPRYFNNGFFISGESYAGKYIPHIVNYIHTQNKKNINSNQMLSIPLTGFAIGNGDTDPLIQSAFVAEMAYNSSAAINNPTHKLPITKQEYQQTAAEMKNCTSLIAICYDTGDEEPCVAAQDCDSSVRHHGIVHERGVNKYNLNLEGDYDAIEDRLETWLNIAAVQEQIGVSPYIEWQKSNHDYHDSLKHSGASRSNSRPLLTEPLNDGIRGLIYAGDLDYVCNWIGNEAWTLELEWNGQKSYNAATRIDWNVNGNVAGEIRQGSNTNFTFVRVYNAGHLVPMDQPAVSLELINQFLSNTLRSSDWSAPESSHEMEEGEGEVEVEVFVSLSASALAGLWGIGCVLLLFVILICRVCKRNSYQKISTMEEPESVIV